LRPDDVIEFKMITYAQWVESVESHGFHLLDGVAVYFGIGMVCIDNKLFKIDLSKFYENMRPAEFDTAELGERMLHSSNWLMKKISYLKDNEHFVRRVGTFILFFGSAVLRGIPLFPNIVTLDRWGPRLRTYDAWLVVLQRWFRRSLHAKKQRLAFAMALHPRLGHFSGASCLGQDLVGKICVWVY